MEITKCLPTIAIVFVLYQKQLHDFHWFPAKNIPKNRWLDDVQEIEGGTQFHPHIISLAVPPVHATKRPSALLFRWLSQCCDSSVHGMIREALGCQMSMKKYSLELEKERGNAIKWVYFAQAKNVSETYVCLQIIHVFARKTYTWAFVLLHVLCLYITLERHMESQKLAAKITRMVRH